MTTRHTLVILMQDRPGALNRVVSLLRRRGFGLESIAVGRSERPGLLRMTAVVEADDIDQAANQLARLIEVISVSNVTNTPAVERELVLAQVHVPPDGRAEVIMLTNAAGARIVDVGASTIVLEMIGMPAQVERFLEVIRPFGIKDLARTGRVVIPRGAHLQPPAIDETAWEHVPEASYAVGAGR
jgi:acetolactate synthase-1/3 small subunit